MPVLNEYIYVDEIKKSLKLENRNTILVTEFLTMVFQLILLTIMMFTPFVLTLTHDESVLFRCGLLVFENNDNKLEIPDSFQMELGRYLVFVIFCTGMFILISIMKFVVEVVLTTMNVQIFQKARPIFSFNFM
ncbi:hypothetical protein RF11_00547 [Thelohanellus kitauei]|uniref:Uncharacterized protein n=1 Tax=Thelohanellus kitauei TaxID=669202 RepID=A0A0C2J8R8_THEKT|nr:hypothetical protein RF11_00547 [Thelohanellus kitauei]